MGTSKWSSKPGNGEWNSVDNWSPQGVPCGTAEFGAASQTAISFFPTDSANVESIEFSEDAPGYTFSFDHPDTLSLTITGAGVTNHSGKQQSFIVATTAQNREHMQMVFANSASAGEEDNYYCAGPGNKAGYGGGVISFIDNATAGSATFKAWTGAESPRTHRPSTVGGEISFSHNATAGTASFTTYGTLGTDGDTFGNVVFHDSATAGRGRFTNIGGTVHKGDGGNTQFYGTSSAANATFYNLGSTSSGYGGDVAFDANADGGYAYYFNYAADAEGGTGGVTSFNNNDGYLKTLQRASAGHGHYINYGAHNGQKGGGGHTSFSSVYGSPTAANATIDNYGSTLESKSSAGHTIFSVNLPSDYYPTAASATINNYPAVNAGCAAGYTEFAVFGSGKAGSEIPTADEATICNHGGNSDKASGGYTVFSGNVTAANATLIAYGGRNGGYGGKIAFYGESTGGNATIKLYDNGTLDIGDHTGGITIGTLELSGGIINTQLGSKLTTLTVSGELKLNASTTFSFRVSEKSGFEFNTPYTILTNRGLSSLSAEQFSGNSIDEVEPTFSAVGEDLVVTFVKG